MAISFDDLIPEQPPAKDASEITFDDLIPKKQAELRAYNPTWRDRIAQFLMPDERASPMRERAVDALMGSRGLGRTGTIPLVDLTPAGIPLAKDEMDRAAEEGDVPGVLVNSLAAIPAPGVQASARGPVDFVRQMLGRKPAPAPKPQTSSVAEAADELGVSIPRAALSTNPVTREAANIVKEVPTVVENPLRGASRRSLEGIEQARQDVVAKAYGRKAGVDDPAAAAERSFDDWLTGRGSLPDAIAETAALRSSMPQKAAPASILEAGEREIITPDQSMTVRAKPELVELSDLKLAGGRFQPRDRGRAEYAQEARERATRLDPEQLKPGRVSDSGAPIVAPDGTILSGNGRALSIKEVYSDPALRERAEAYRASLGPEAAKMRQPVLVMRTQAMPEDEMARFADLSNRGRIASMSATERAARDAEALGPEIMALYKGGDFDAEHNLPFMRAFSERVVTAAERPAFSKEGKLTLEGVNRMRAAVLASAYGDPAMLSRMLESTDDNIRNVTAAMTEAAPLFAALKADIAAGRVMPGLDPTPHLTRAVRIIADLRSRRVPISEYAAQIDAFADPDDIAAQPWVLALYRDDLARPLGRDQMTALLKGYAEEAAKHAPGGLIPDETTARDVLNVARGNATGKGGESPGALQSATEAGQVDGRQAAPDGLEGGVPGVGAADEVGDAAEAQGRAALTEAEAEEIAVRQLVDARRAALGQALDLDAERVTLDSVVERVAELARTRGPDATDSIKLAKKHIAGLGHEGDRIWADTVVPRFLEHIGIDDLETFAQNWKALSNGNRKVIVQSKRRPGLKDRLDALAEVAQIVPRLRELSTGELENLIAKTPMVGNLLRFFVRGKAGQLFTYGGLSSIAGGVPLHIPPIGYVVGSIMSRPAAVRDVTRYAKSLLRIIEEGAEKSGAKPNRASSAALRLSARALAMTLAREFGGEQAEYDARLTGEIVPGEPNRRPPGMMRLGGPKPEDQQPSEPGVIDTALDYAGRGLAVVDLYTGGILSALAGLNPFTSYGRVMEARERALRDVPRDIKAAATEPFNPVAAIFAGPRMAERLFQQGITGPKRALDLAEKMERQGASREEIYRETSNLLKGTPYAGVSKDAGGKWRFEISDDLMTFKEGQGFNLIDHPEMAKALPKHVMDDLHSTVMVGHDAGGNYSMGAVELPSGERRPAYLVIATGEDENTAKETLAHELNHFVQDWEGFSRGANPDALAAKRVTHRAKSPPTVSVGTFSKSIGPSAGEPPEPRQYPGSVVLMRQEAPENQLAEERRRQFSGQGWRFASSVPDRMAVDALHMVAAAPEGSPEREKALRDLRAIVDRLEGGRAFDLYMNTGGERSSREAADRVHWRPSQRRRTPPSLYEDDPSSGAIAQIGQNPSELSGYALKPDRETIARLPETRALADKLHEKLAKAPGDKSDAELWEIAYASAIAEMERRIDAKGIEKAVPRKSNNPLRHFRRDDHLRIAEVLRKRREERRRKLLKQGIIDQDLF